jgi:hypothetical protein
MGGALTTVFLLALVTAEIVDPREVDWDPGPDLVERITWLADAPYTSEANRFHHIHCLLTYYEPALCLARCGERERLYAAEDYHEVASACTCLLAVLSAIQDAQNPNCYIVYRRDRLRYARDNLDPDDWKRGIPP